MQLLQKLHAIFGSPDRTLSPPAFVLPPQATSYENLPPALEAPSAPSGYGLPPPSISLEPGVDGAAAPALVLPPSGRSPPGQYDLTSPGRGPYMLSPSGRAPPGQYDMTPPGRGPYMLSPSGRASRGQYDLAPQSGGPYMLPASGRGAPHNQYFLTPSGRNPLVLQNPYPQTASGVPNGASGSPWSPTGFVYPAGGASPSLLAQGQQPSPSGLALSQAGVPSPFQGVYTGLSPSSGASDPVPVPSDPVSMQLALNAREQALKKVVDDELSFGFKTLPKDGAMNKVCRNFI